jgi:hypothetical protein
MPVLPALAAALTGALVPGQVLLPLDGTWITVSEEIRAGELFRASIEFESDVPVMIRIADIYVAGDRFEVRDFGALVAETSDVRAWNEIPGVRTPFEEPYWSSDPEAAIAAGTHSWAAFEVSAGAHVLSVRNLNIPVNWNGEPFIDSNFAMSATPIPAPAAVATGACALVLCMAHRRRTGGA